jgi:hypothetical protein
MKSPALLRALVALACVVLVGWIVTHTRWVEVEVKDDLHGLAATDPEYALRRVLEGAGATLEVRTALEPLPPGDATLLLDSGLWDIFPERDAHLRAWVEAGGHLVVLGRYSRDDILRWVPLTFADPARRRDAPAAKPQPAASAAEDDDDDEQEVPAEPAKPVRVAPMSGPPALRGAFGRCSDFRETELTTAPAFEPGRVYRGCGVWEGAIHPIKHVRPTWNLASKDGTLALRVPVGRGDVTGVAPFLVLDNRALLQGDNALIAVAVLQAVPGRAVWIVRDESREPLIGWLWHEARTPFLLALAAILLALWRLAVRFGPREAVPPQARRSMGEQVRGTGEFIAATDPRALHAATRKAFEDVARTRVEAWSGREDADRIAALAASIAPTHTLDAAALQASMNVGDGATPTQILTAIAVLEQARRALLRAPASPFAH